MQIRAVKAPLVHPGESLEAILDASIPSLAENTIVCITSKIISLCENEIVTKDAYPDKRKLIEQEAEYYLPEQKDNPYNISLTIKNSLLIPTAGIDESNGDEIYILFPRDIPASAARIWSYLRTKHNIKNLGVLITDSHTTPMRRGVTGIALGWCGFEAIYSYVGKPDCFGKPLRVTWVNLLDALAVPAVYAMGEGNEQTPIALINDAPKITFQDRPPTTEEIAAITISLETDLYAPVFRCAPWIKNPNKA